MLIINNKALKVGNKWLNPVESPAPTPPGPTFDEVTIGTQTWMAQDLNIDDGGSGIVTVEEITYQGDSTIKWLNHKFYTRSAAMRIADTIPGWRLPTKEDYQTLYSTLGNNSSNVKHLFESPWSDDSYGFGLVALTPTMLVSTGNNYKPTTSDYSNYTVSNWSYATLVTSTFQYGDYSFPTFGSGDGQYANYTGPNSSNVETVCAQVRLIKDT